MKQAWHRINEEKSLYFLVKVLPHQENSHKIPVQFEGEKYLVHKDDIFSYNGDKKQNIYKIDQINKAQIIDWFKKNFEKNNYWIKVNKRLTIDFNNQTDKQREKFIKYILGCFLINQKKRHYVCVSNDWTMCNKNGNIINTFFKVAKESKKLWNYKISIEDLSKIYSIFFRDIPIKLKIFIKNQEIIRLSIIPYHVFSKDLLGKKGVNEIMTLTARIFNAMGTSSREIKNYYKVPPRSTSSLPQKQDLQKITTYLMNIGFSLSEIKGIIQMYALIMNINSLQLCKGKKNQDKYLYKIRQGSHSQGNLKKLIGEQLTYLLQQQINEFDDEIDYTKQNINLKQQLLIRIIYENITFKLAQILNEKMCNIECQFKDYKQFIIIQFPSLDKKSQKSPQQYFINLVQQKIQTMALKISLENQTHNFKYDPIYRNLKQYYQYDINTQILQQINKSIKWSEKLKLGKFITALYRHKITSINNNDTIQRKGKIQRLFQQLDKISQFQNYEINFIIQTRIQQKNTPLRPQLINLLEKSLNKNKQDKNKKIQQAKKKEDQGGKDGKEDKTGKQASKSKKQDSTPVEQPQKINNEQENNELQQDMIEVKQQKFVQRYCYCSFVKQLQKQSPQISFLQKLANKFTTNQQKNYVNNSNQIIYLTVQKYLQFEDQRYEQEKKINRIKSQFKRAKFRNEIFKNLHQLYRKIKLNNALMKIIKPIQQQNFKMIKNRAAIEILSNIKFTLQKVLLMQSMKNLRYGLGFKKIKTILENKESLNGNYKHFFNKLHKILKKKRCPKIVSKITSFQQKINQKLEKIFLTKLNQEYQGIIKSLPPPKQQKDKTNTNNIPITPNDSPNKQLPPPPRQKPDKTNSSNIPINSNNPPNNPINNTNNPDKVSGSNNINNPNILNNPNSASSPNKTNNEIINNRQNQIIEPPRSSIDSSDKIQISVLKANQKPPVNPQNLATSIKKQSEQKKKEQPKQDLNQSIVSSPPSNYSSYGQSTNRGMQKSQICRQITRPQFLKIQDNPKFTFEIWCKQAIGFQKKKPSQPESVGIVPCLFLKPDSEKLIIKQNEQQLNVDILIKQKVVVNPFLPYLLAHINTPNQQQIHNIMSHQSKLIKSPLLIDFPISKYPKIPQEIFNNILKLGKDKNTSKKRSQLISMIVKYIHQTYHNQKKNVSTIFEGQPPIITDYTWNHNIIKDEIFIQFIKQIMMNQQQDSLKSLSLALQVITRYYYPSPKFIYSFLHFLKSFQSKNIQKLNQCFINTLLFAQIYQRYRGNTVTILKQEVIPKDNQIFPRFQPRTTPINQNQVDDCVKIQLRLINQQIFQFKVRNQTISHFKRQVLQKINMLHYEEYFGVYFSVYPQGNHWMLAEAKKAIDFLHEYPQEQKYNIIYIKLKHYYPFNIKQVNKARIFFLNSIMQQKSLPWKLQNYQACVVHSMIFQQFEDYRISNYLMFTNQPESNVDLQPIQKRYTEQVSQRGKKINQIQYFKEIKQNGFLAGKAYDLDVMSPQSPLYEITKIVIKPLQLCFYKKDKLIISMDLKRIKGYGFEKNQIHLQFDYEEQTHRGLRQLIISKVDKINELYIDLSAYIGFLNDA